MESMKQDNALNGTNLYSHIFVANTVLHIWGPWPNIVIVIFEENWYTLYWNFTVHTVTRTF